MPNERVHRSRHLAGNRYGWECHWCGTLTACRKCWPNSKHAEATLEHVRRLADGGNWGIGNLRIACPPCNNNRHNDLHPVARAGLESRPGLPEPNRPHRASITPDGLSREGRITVYDSAYARVGYIGPDGRTVWLPPRQSPP